VGIDGSEIALETLRGRPVLLFFFASFDGPSQLALTPLSEVVEGREDVVTIGVALQPDAATFADAWAAALDPPFRVASDPADQIVRGLTALGGNLTVPTFVILDEHGIERGRHVGVAMATELEALLGRVLDP
jgi:peroxiredoxin